jgi:hypothetical protein
MVTRIPFNGGSLMLSEAGSFTGKTGEIVKLEPAVVVIGVKSKAIRLPVDVVDAIIALGKNDDYKEFARKAKQPKP